MMRKTVFGGIAWVILAMSAFGQSTGSTPEFKPKTLMGPRKAIVKAPFLPAGRVTNQVSDDELVIGVVVKGEARAYPLNMLCGPSREIINDVVGRVPIAATW